MPDAFALAADALTCDALRARGGERWAAVPDGAIPAWIAEMSLPVAPVVRSALEDLVARGELGYVSAQRQQAYRVAVADWYASEHGHALDAEHVHPVGDVIEAYRKALSSLAPDAPVVVPIPSYPPFLFVAAEERRRVVTIPADAERGIDLDALDAALEPGALLVLCTPSNPFGRVPARAELEAIATIVDRHGARVLSDEIHAPLVLAGGGTHVPYASIGPVAAAHAMTAFSASKAFDLPGLKCAALITSTDADLAWWRSLGPIASHGASIAGLVAGTAALRDGRAWLADAVSYLSGNRDRVAEVLGAVGSLRMTPAQATYLQWIEHVDAGAVAPAAALAARGLVVSDGAAFGGFPHAFRLNFALPRPVLERALTLVVDAFGHGRAAA